MWKRTITVITVIGALLAVTGSAYAAEGGTTDAKRKPGYLVAKGTGHVELDVERAVVKLRLNGDITIEGPAGLDVRIDGARYAAPEGDADGTFIQLTDFQGKVVVRGQDYTVTVDGKVFLKGKGSGNASFLGEGWWKTRHKRGLWPADEPQPQLFGATG